MTLPVPALMVIPLPVAGAVIAAQPLPLTVTGVVMLSGPYLPGSSAAIMPLAPITVYACAKLAHGWVMVHGLPSLPADETNERGSIPFWACAGSERASAAAATMADGKIWMRMEAPQFNAAPLGPHPWEP